MLSGTAASRRSWGLLRGDLLVGKFCGIAARYQAALPPIGTEGVCLLTSRFPAASPAAALSPTRDPRGGGSRDRRVPISIPIPRKPERKFPSPRKTARAAAVQEQHPQLIPSLASHPSLVSRAVPARSLSLRHSLALDQCCRQGSLRHSSFCL
ncbi:hypothetical protein PVAP13_3KG450501 [Panicum virgatum]|uniref:Uncharacterized protein n=1 Tax=Panicum virgatum TaxID=38727 RepID=A0A8T0V673_PANVG|nr:hypothetical protein PVAP13_3KG450501 [Panicum virgatum]